MRPAVVVMVKAPRAGLVKTRLTPPLTEEAAAVLAACFVQDTVRSAALVASNLIIAYAPPDGRPALESLLPRRDLLWLEQQGADLGARLEGVAARAFGSGYSPLVFLGADSPTLPPSFIERAMQGLAAAESDIALGATDDGGYYLVGLRQPSVGIFQDISWSTPRAYVQTARNAARLRLRLLELPRWYDVDTPSDLERLRAEIFSGREARQRAPATYRWLRQQQQPRQQE